MLGGEDFVQHGTRLQQCRQAPGLGSRNPLREPLGIQNAFSIEMAFLMGECVPRHFETIVKLSQHISLAEGAVGWGRREEGSRAREEKDGKETCQFSPLGSQHEIRALAALREGRFLHVPSCPIFSLHPTGPFSVAGPPSPSAFVQDSESQPSEALPSPSPDTYVQSPKYSREQHGHVSAYERSLSHEDGRALGDLDLEPS